MSAFFDCMGSRTIDEGESDDAVLGETAAKVLKSAFELLRSAGADIIDVSDVFPAAVTGRRQEDTGSEEQDLSGPGEEVMCQGFRARLDRYLSDCRDIPVKNLHELIIWNREHPEAIPYGQDYLERLEDIRRPVMNPSFISHRMSDLGVCGEKGVWEAFERYELNALILPGLAGQGIAATAGNPTISIPAGYTEETGPVGLNLVGDIMCDAELLRIARACEKVLPHVPAPKL